MCTICRSPNLTNTDTCASYRQNFRNSQKCQWILSTQVSSILGFLPHCSHTTQLRQAEIPVLSWDTTVRVPNDSVASSTYMQSYPGQVLTYTQASIQEACQLYRDNSSISWLFFSTPAGSLPFHLLSKAVQDFQSGIFLLFLLSKLQ